MLIITRLILIITTFFGMTGGCKQDIHGNSLLLDSTTINPHRLESGCWYSIASSSTLHVTAVIERMAEHEKLYISWEHINEHSLFTILFDWDGIPYYNISNSIYKYNKL